MTPLDAVRARVRSERGVALPLALLVLLLVSVVGFAVIGMGMTEVSVATNWRSYNTAFYAADAGLQKGLVDLRALFAQTPTPTTAQVNAITPPTLSNVRVNSAALTITPGVAPYRTTFTSGPYKGLYGFVTDYQITSQATMEDGAQANLTQTVRYTSVPLFQFGIFYGKGLVLDINPGPTMNITGKVHANSDMYIDPGVGLTFNGNLTSAGKILRGTSYGGSDLSGPAPQIMDASGVSKALTFDHDHQSAGTSWVAPATWRDTAQTTFGGTVQDKDMGVSEIIPPVPALLTDPANPDVVAHQLIELPQVSDSAGLKAAKLYSQAGLRIVDGVATDMNGSPVALPAGALTTKSFVDPREGRTVNLYEVDVGVLTAANLPALTTGTGKGILYVASTALPTGSALPIGSTAVPTGTMPGVRLVNGATFNGSAAQTGLSVVSQNPIYVQGDYNVTANFTNPVTGLASHPPAAVMGDAITALSNNWGPNNSDTKGTQDPGQRSACVTPCNAAAKALGTTQNAAFMTGPNRESVPGPWNGAVHNDIRFLEDWNANVKFNYNGSLVTLWHSQQATADFRGCTGTLAGGGCYYVAPQRNWGYDPLFNAVPPPGAPGAIVISLGQWAQK